MATIVYFHGFASVGEGPKSESLRARFPNHTVIAPNIPANPKDAVKLLTAVIREAKDYPIVFVGTSLGGFWANYMAQKFDVPAILVNPSVYPSKTMEDRIGQVFENYRTGEKIEITADDVETFKKLEEEAIELYNGALIDLFLTKDDEVLPYHVALNSFMRHTKSRHVAETGGHRYLEDWDRIENAVNELIN